MDDPLSLLSLQTQKRRTWFIFPGQNTEKLAGPITSYSTRLPKYGPESPQGGPNIRDQAEMEPLVSGGNAFGVVKPSRRIPEGGASTRGASLSPVSMSSRTPLHGQPRLYRISTCTKISQTIFRYADDLLVSSYSNFYGS
jgi:hypothetical protein